MENMVNETPYVLGSLLSMKTADTYRQTATDELIHLMGAKGWNHFHSSFVSSEKYVYHVKTRRAWVHSLFFHTPGRPLLVKATLNYNLYEDGSGSSLYWGFEIYARSSPINDMYALATNYQIPMDNSGMYGDCTIQVPQYPLFVDRSSVELALPAFGYYGGSRTIHCDTYQAYRNFEQPIVGDAASPNLVMTSIHRLIDPAMPFIGQGKFDKLGVTSFPEHYVFETSEPDFWASFNWGYFNKCVASTYYPK